MRNYIRLRFICAAKEFGFSLAETAEMLDKSNKGKSSCPLVKEIILRNVDANRRGIKGNESAKADGESGFSSDGW